MMLTNPLTVTGVVEEMAPKMTTPSQPVSNMVPINNSG
jgi:hypothetical protein